MNHKDLDVWQLSIETVGEIYTNTAKFPKEEKFGLSQQMRRCAVSISSNIAEGAARRTKREFRYFLYVSLGSTSELETQTIIANNLKFIDSMTFNGLMGSIVRIKMMLIKLIEVVGSRVEGEAGGGNREAGIVAGKLGVVSREP